MAAGSAEGANASVRACAWADHLVTLGRVDQARQVLRAALDGTGDRRSVALELAKLDISSEASASAVELLRKVLEDHPGDLDTVRLLTETLLADGQADEAAKVLGSTTPPNGALRELAGQICRAQGRHAEAVAAFGPRS